MELRSVCAHPPLPRKKSMKLSNTDVDVAATDAADVADVSDMAGGGLRRGKRKKMSSSKLVGFVRG